MGCGCAERKRKAAEWLERKGMQRTAKVVRKIPAPAPRKKSSD